MNVYYDPEKFGLEKVAEVDFAGSYEFDIWLALRDPDNGVLYLTHDSGCSCPMPFEDIGRNDLTACRKWADFDAWVERMKTDSWRDFDDPDEYENPQPALAEFLERVRRNHTFAGSTR